MFRKIAGAAFASSAFMFTLLAGPSLNFTAVPQALAANVQINCPEGTSPQCDVYTNSSGGQILICSCG